MVDQLRYSQYQGQKNEQAQKKRESQMDVAMRTVSRALRYCGTRQNAAGCECSSIDDELVAIHDDSVHSTLSSILAREHYHYSNDLENCDVQYCHHQAQLL